MYPHYVGRVPVCAAYMRIVPWYLLATEGKRTVKSSVTVADKLDPNFIISLCLSKTRSAAVQTDTSRCTVVTNRNIDAPAPYWHLSASLPSVNTKHGKRMHGQLPRKLDEKLVEIEQSNRWLKSADIKGETESTIVASQDQEISTIYFKKKKIWNKKILTT